MTSSFTSCGAPSEHAAILPVVLGSQQSGLPDWAMALIRGSELVDMPESARASSSTSAQPECPTTPPLASRGGTPRAATQLTIAIAGNVNRGTGTDGGDMGSHAHSVPDTEIHSFSPTPAPPPRTATLRYAAGPPTPSEKQFGGPSRHLQDLNAGLASNAWRRAFAQFLTKEFCTESLLFVRAVDCFKETADDALFPSVAERDAASIRRANFIAAHFLVEGAPGEINVPSQIRDRAIVLHSESASAGLRVPPHVFDEACEHVKHMMAADLMPRFVRSDMFTRYAAKRPVAALTESPQIVPALVAASV